MHWDRAPLAATGEMNVLCKFIVVRTNKCSGSTDVAVFVTEHVRQCGTIKSKTEVVTPSWQWTSIMVQSPSWETDNCKDNKKCLIFHGTRRYITVFTIARHLSSATATWIPSRPSHSQHILTVRLILLTMLRSSKWSFPFGFSEQYVMFLVSSYYMPPIISSPVWKPYKLWSPSCWFTHSRLQVW